jgi:hypothetical protein
MKIEILNDSKDQWNRFVDTHPLSIAWHRWEWSEAVKSCYGNSTFHPMAALEDDKIRGIVPLYLWSHGKTRSAISVPYAVAGGIAAETGEAAAALLSGAIEFTHSQNVNRLVLKQYKVRIEGALTTDDHYHNRELSLTPDIGRLERSITPFNARKIEESGRMGLTYEHPSTDVDGFYDATFRFHHGQGLPCVAKKWITTLTGLGMYTIATARKDGKIVAATMIKEFKKTISFPFSCTVAGSDESESAMYGLYWHLITAFALKGFEIFHSGRMPNNEDTLQFRKGWGGAKHPYYYQFYPQTTTASEFGTRRGWKRRLFNVAWKRTPLFVARVLGPRIVIGFP